MTFTLKACRVNKNLSLEDAAKELGISLHTLKNYEAGTTYPPIDIVFKMLALYKVKIEAVDFLIKD